MAQLIRMLHRWICLQCELVSPWSSDIRLVTKESEAHVEAKGHTTNTYSVPEKAVKHERG